MNFDPLDTCPYDPVHRILRSRMQYHLTRCAKNFPCSKKKKCPFDACHIINQVEYNYHVSTCPARESVLHYKIIDPDVTLEDKLLPIRVEPVIVSSEENWENDPEVISYNPLQHLAERPIVRTLIGGSRAQRKKFRLQERRRIQQIENGIEQSKQQEQMLKNNSKSSIKSTASKSQVSEETYDQESKPLRRPKSLHQSCDQSLTMKSNHIKTTVQNETPVTKQTENENTDTKIDAKERKTISVKVDTEKKIGTDKQINSVTSTNKVPFSYAAALNNKNTSASEENEIKNRQHMSFNNNNISLNRTIDDSIIEKMSKTIEDIAIADEVCTKESKPIEQQIKFFKQRNTNVNSVSGNEKRNEKAVYSTNKKFSRCAANFSELK